MGMVDQFREADEPRLKLLACIRGNGSVACRSLLASENLALELL
jgi:hypothetical protein